MGEKISLPDHDLDQSISPNDKDFDQVELQSLKVESAMKEALKRERRRRSSGSGGLLHCPVYW